MSWETVRELLFICLAVYVAFGAYLYVFQRSIIYHPDGQSFEDCPGFAESEHVRHNGTRMYHTAVSDKLVVFYHGNAGSACDRSHLKDRFAQMGYSSLFVEYAGFSNDSSTPTKELLLANARDAAQFVSEQDYEQVFVFGSSLGSSMAAAHATAGIDGLVLVSPYDTLENVARGYYPFYPASWLVKDDFDNAALLQDYEDPVLILHAEHDSVVPVERGRELAEEVDAQFVVVDEAGHNSVYTETFWARVEEFLP